MEEASGSRCSRYELRSKKKISDAEHRESSPFPKRAKEKEAVPVKKADYDTRFRAPDRTPRKELMAVYERKCRECIETALKFLNKSKKAKKVGEYELVEARDVCTFNRGMEGIWFHANFKAKPKNAPEAESKNFFAELNYRYAKPLKCVKCCILGPLDYGSHGCKACEKFYPRLRHPLEGFHIGHPP